MVTGRQFPYVESLEHIVNCRTHRSCSVAGFALDDGLQVHLYAVMDQQYREWLWRSAGDPQRNPSCTSYVVLAR